jgi:hypothetical protein
MPPNVQVAYYTGDGNHVTWEPLTEPDFDHYRVYRHDNGALTGTLATTTTLTHWYDPENDGAGVTYTVTGVDDAGNEGPHGGPQVTTAATDTPPPQTPEQTTLYQNNPNPFNPTTTIRFYLTERTNVTLTIFDAAGRRVRRLLDGPAPQGHNRTVWDGRNSVGQQVSSGVYFYRLEAGRFTETKKMVLLK